MSDIPDNILLKALAQLKAKLGLTDEEIDAWLDYETHKDEYETEIDAEKLKSPEKHSNESEE